uniref:Acyltransferase 3 domain-containing protein n=1 Tax=Anopheles merus TaxID=30066 RepID=A0A1Y9IS55_ANOME
MPKLWQMDDYDECLESPEPDDPPGVYCGLSVVLKPNNRSELWKLIEEFSSDYKRHYNHQVLKRGVCIRRCQKAIEKLSPAERNALTVEPFPIDVRYKFNDGILKDIPTYREAYQDVVEICVNKELNDTYGLVAHTEILSCDKSTDEVVIDALDMSFLIVLCALVSFVTVSSWYDSLINYKRTSDHYRQPLDSKRKMVWVSFSIQRNWYRLTSRSRDELNQKLRFFQAFRFLTIVLIIFGHFSMLLSVTPTTNSEKLERIMHNVGSMILTNGGQITQTFLGMSGVLLGIKFCSFAEKRKGKLQTGPLWSWIAKTEQIFCRRNWWTNLLYINNYVHADEPCVQQAWYLGAEFQIFIIALIVLVTIVKIPRAKVLILGLVLLAGYVIPALFIYYHKLEGTYLITLEAQRYLLWYDKYYLHAYIPTHINFGNYIQGVLTGLVYCELQKRSINLAQSKAFSTVWHLTIVILPLSWLPSYMFYVNDFPTPSIWMAAYFIMTKNLYGFGIGIIILGCIYGVNGVVKRMLNYPFFEPLGRLTYGAFLVHPFVMRFMFASVRAPAHYSDLLTLSLVFGATVMSYLMALVLCLLIELPTTALQNHFFGSFKEQKSNHVDPETVTNGTNQSLINTGHEEKKGKLYAA